MIDFIDLQLAPAIWFTAEWSLRWGALIAMILMWFAIRAPKAAAVRLFVLRLTLVAGLLLPLVPVAWGPKVNVLEPVEISPRQTSPKQPVVTEVIPRAEEARNSRNAWDVMRRLAAKTPAPATPKPDTSAPANSIIPVTDSPIVESEMTPPLEPTNQQSWDWLRISFITIAAAWALGVLIQLLRLTSGWIWLQRLCRDGTLLSEHYENEFAACRRKLNINRRVQMKMQAAVDSPILVAGWVPTILVPTQWNQLSSSAREAILLHELSHAQRRDDLARIAEELIRAIFFFHPLVHWLLRRIDADREEACDAAVIHQGITPREIARVLLECCQNPNVGQPALRLRSVAVPLFRRNTVKERIQTLMEEQDMTRWRLGISPRRIVGLVALVAVATAIIGGFALRAEEPAVRTGAGRNPAQQVSAANSAAQTPPANKENGKPAPAAATGRATPPNPNIPVIDIREWLPESEFQKFAAEEPVDIPVFGRFDHHDLMETIMSAAYPDELPRCRLVDVQGKPLQGTPKNPATARIAYQDYIPQSSVLANSKGEFCVVPPHTERMGRNGIPVWIKIGTGQVFMEQIRPVAKQVVEVRLPFHQHPQVAAPENVKRGEVAGQVVDEQGRPLVGVEIYIPGKQGFTLKGRTDQLGHYRLVGFEDQLEDENDPREVDDDAVFVSSSALIQLRKPGYSMFTGICRIGAAGVFALENRTWIEGTVRGPDGNPVAGALVRHYQGRETNGPDNNEVYYQPGFWNETQSDAAGMFRIYCTPGPCEVVARKAGVGVARILAEPITRDEHRRLDVALKSGRTLSLTLVDSETKDPVQQLPVRNYHDASLSGASDAQGHFVVTDLLPGKHEFVIDRDRYGSWIMLEQDPPLTPPKPTPASKGKRPRPQIMPAGGNSGRRYGDIEVNLDSPQKSLKVAVERKASLRGRVIDPNGQSVPGATIFAVLTDPESGQGNSHYQQVTVGANGEFNLAISASGNWKYRLTAEEGAPYSSRKWASGVSELLAAAPGQDVSGVTVKLMRPAVVRGTCIDEQGRPVLGCIVQFASVTRVAFADYRDIRESCDSSGRFSAKLRPGKYRVNVTPPKVRYTAIVQEVSVGDGETSKNLEFRIPPEGKRGL